MNITTRYPRNRKCVEIGFLSNGYVQETLYKGGDLEGFIDQLEDLLRELKNFRESNI
jgi:hypothetical protein